MYEDCTQRVTQPKCHLFEKIVRKAQGCNFLNDRRVERDFVQYGIRTWVLSNTVKKNLQQNQGRKNLKNIAMTFETLVFTETAIL
jgi:hypothetical protein